MEPIAVVIEPHTTRVLTEPGEGRLLEVEYLGRKIKTGLAWFIEVDRAVVEQLRDGNETAFGEIAVPDPTDPDSYNIRAEKVWVIDGGLKHIASRLIREVPLQPETH